MLNFTRMGRNTSRPLVLSTSDNVKKQDLHRPPAGQTCKHMITPPLMSGDAKDFAPRLHQLHRALDEAVCDAYGWPYGVLDAEEEMLRRLLALNLERAG
ncbi:MAG: hypothetical protein L0154_12285 [Chloroflexi bacterium]|nr:hypothetical protein [Chloroflexota bacterium]